MDAKVLVCWIKLHQLKRCKGALCITLALKELGCNSPSYNHHASAWDILWEVCTEAATAKHVFKWFYTNLKTGKHTTWRHTVSPVLLFSAMLISAAQLPHNTAGICRSTRFADCVWNLTDPSWKHPIWIVSGQSEHDRTNQHVYRRKI